MIRSDKLKLNLLFFFFLTQQNLFHIYLALLDSNLEQIMDYNYTILERLLHMKLAIDGTQKIWARSLKYI